MSGGMVTKGGKDIGKKQKFQGRTMFNDNNMIGNFIPSNFSGFCMGVQNSQPGSSSIGEYEYEIDLGGMAKGSSGAYVGHQAREHDNLNRSNTIFNQPGVIHEDEEEGEEQSRISPERREEDDYPNSLGT